MWDSESKGEQGGESRERAKGEGKDGSTWREEIVWRA
jgi:hypothetical protein